MRALLAGIFALAFIPFASAQTILKREPHYLPPGAVVLVDNGQCGIGKVMKVTGIAKGSLRRKACVTPVAQQVALRAPPWL